jgi:6-phosphofructokinase
MKRRCIIGQSGGSTVVINATLAGIIKNAYKKEYEKVYGMINGISGLLNEKIVNLENLKNEDYLKKLINTPAMYLGSCRFKITEKDENILKRIFDILKKYEITDFFYIGGNDSMDTIKKLTHFANKIQSPIHFIGIPKTIDNDLMHTEYTPGYPSACRYVANSLLEIVFDSVIYPIKSVTIVEIMGRDAGWLTAASQLVNEVYPQAIDFIYMPEIIFNEDKFIDEIKSKLQIKDNIVIAVSEGICDKYGTCISLDNGITRDAFGHMSNNGCSNYLKKIISHELGIKVRSIQLNTLQRCAIHLSSKVDVDNAIYIGEYAVKCALDNRTGIMVTILKNRREFLFSYSDIDGVANYVRKFPLEWIDIENRKIKKEYVDYVVPLIYKSGKIELPQYLKRYDKKSGI